MNRTSDRKLRLTTALAAISLSLLLGSFCLGTTEAKCEAESTTVELEQILLLGEHRRSMPGHRRSRLSHAGDSGSDICARRFQLQVTVIPFEPSSQHNGIGRPLTT